MVEDVRRRRNFREHPAGNFDRRRPGIKRDPCLEREKRPFVPGFESGAQRTLLDPYAHSLRSGTVVGTGNLLRMLPRGSIAAVETVILIGRSTEDGKSTIVWVKQLLACLFLYQAR